MREMLRHRPLQEVQQRRIIHALGIHELIDTAHAETERATLDTRAVHVVSNEQDEVQELFEVRGVEQRATGLGEFARGVVEERPLFVEFELVEHVLDPLA